jgi:transcriptional regulator GlxA family with amidase domain
VARAQHLLVAYDLSIEQIATDVGFGTALSLRQHFAKLVRTFPSGG